MMVVPVQALNSVTTESSQGQAHVSWNQKSYRPNATIHTNTNRSYQKYIILAAVQNFADRSHDGFWYLIQQAVYTKCTSNYIE